MASDPVIKQLGITAGSPSSVLAAPPVIHDLVAKFAEHHETCKRREGLEHPEN
jgi:hypothetical protein